MRRKEALNELARILDIDTIYLAELLTCIMAPHGEDDWFNETKITIPVTTGYCTIEEVPLK